jgi:hypothetical protein
MPLLLYVLALVVRGLLIWHFPDPAYPDSAYYVDVARALHAGQGFNVDFIWIFAEVGGSIPTNPVLPIASNAHWMPLASLVQVPFLFIFGDVAWASAAPFALIGALAAPLTWAIARDVGARPLVAIGAGILVAIPVLSLAFMAQPDNFSLYQPLVAASLWMAARSLRSSTGSGKAFVVAGLLAGIATLARTDGVLVLAALGLVFAWDRTRARRSPQLDAGGALIAGAPLKPAIPVWAALACVAVFALVMAPWWARQLLTFGSLSPSMASGKVLFIRDISEWNDITTPATLDHLLGMGIVQLITTRIGGFVAAATIYLILVCGVVLGPPMLFGAWARRRSRDFLPFFTYAAILFGFSGLVSAVHVPGGTFIHSAVALVPHGYILALEGIGVGVAWIAARRPAWRAINPTRLFTGSAIAFSLVIALLGTQSVHSTWAARRDRASTIAAAFEAAGVPAGDRVMSIDAAGLKYATGLGGVVLVNDSLGTILDVGFAYGIRWLVLDASEGVASVAPILDDDQRPAWIGPPIYTERGSGVTASGTDRRYSLGIYPVCLDGSFDPRCFSNRGTTQP